MSSCVVFDGSNSSFGDDLQSIAPSKSIKTHDDRMLSIKSGSFVNTKNNERIKNTETLENYPEEHSSVKLRKSSKKERKETKRRKKKKSESDSHDRETTNGSAGHLDNNPHQNFQKEKTKVSKKSLELKENFAQSYLEETKLVDEQSIAVHINPIGDVRNIDQKKSTVNYQNEIIRLQQKMAKLQNKIAYMQKRVSKLQNDASSYNG